MPISLSKKLKISASEITDRDAFDPILDVDTRLFIDPHLLKHSKVPEFTESYKKLQKYFSSIAKLLSASDSTNDVFWKKADKMMQWSEVKGLCIGYSAKGTSGSGIGIELRKRLLETAKIIIDKGRKEPELFELVGIFEDGFGSDRISDMTANVIRDDIIKFTNRVFSELDVNVSKYLEIDKNSNLPINPFNKEVIYLVPQSLLRDLPVALDWSNYDTIATHNKELRERLNGMIGYTWKQATHGLKKYEIKDYIFKNPELFDDLVQIYSEKEAQPYNFLFDRSGEYVWYPVAQKITKDNPLKINLPKQPAIDQVEEMVLAICNRFKDLVENNNLSSLLYNADRTPKHESASQLIFYGVAEAYCEANNILIARESDSGRGPVDFKFGTNLQNSVLVELKKSTNTSGLKKGVTRQLPEYMKSEKSKRAIYLVIDVGYTRAAIRNLREISKAINGSAIKIIQVDGNPKASASRLI